MPIVTARCPRQRKPFTGACAGLNRKAVCALARNGLCRFWGLAAVRCAVQWERQAQPPSLSKCTEKKPAPGNPDAGDRVSAKVLSPAPQEELNGLYGVRHAALLE
jgi:hypothetical protein